MSRGKGAASKKTAATTATHAPVPALVKPPIGATLTKSVYEQLRTDLLTGRLKAGEKLGAEALRTRFKVGSSPIREALNRLLSEGFVSLEEQKGFRVAPLSVEDMRELVAARIWIDGAATTASIERYETRWEEHLVLAFHRLSKVERRRASTGGDNAVWEGLHRNFHMALVGGCGSRWMIKISAQLFDSAERYRLYAASSVSERNELDEHRQVLEACLDRKPELAVNLLKLHYGRTSDVVTSFMASRKGPVA